MPTINCPRTHLFHLLQQEYSDTAFDELCFQFGIELDEVTSEREIAQKSGAQQTDGLSEEVLYKIEVPANRYDLLSIEGIALALRIFLQKQQIPTYKCVLPSNPITLTQKKSTSPVRPVVVACVLRDITFTPENYASFIDLQDKLHQNVGRRRTLVSMGTHDLDKITLPLSYDAVPFDSCKFVPLNETKPYTVTELYQYYRTKSQSHLKPYLDICGNADKHPVILDSKGNVCSLPPVINSELTKISLQTKNVLIEITGTDDTKVNIALHSLIAAFSAYCKTPYVIEGVQIINEVTGKTYTTPSLYEPTFHASVPYINQHIGIQIPADEMCQILNRMQLRAKVDTQNKDTLIVSAPITRSDIMHQCDIMEDVAIAYGYNRLTHTLPKQQTVGVPNRINVYSDQIRQGVSECGFMEVLTFTLISHDENYRNMRQPADRHDAVVLANAKSSEFQLVRTSLLPGLLKTLGANYSYSLPIKIFECGDVCIVDEAMKQYPHGRKSDTGASNYRRIAALYSNNSTSGFEIVQGLMDRILQLNGVAHEPTVRMEEQLRAKKRTTAKPTHATNGDDGAAEDNNDDAPQQHSRLYSLRKSSNPSFFTGRAADIILTTMHNGKRQEQQIGTFGIVHPEVLEHFSIPNPTSAVELDLQALCDLEVPVLR